VRWYLTSRCVAVVVACSLMLGTVAAVSACSPQGAVLPEPSHAELQRLFEDAGRPGFRDKFRHISSAEASAATLGQPIRGYRITRSFFGLGNDLSFEPENHWTVPVEGNGRVLEDIGIQSINGRFVVTSGGIASLVIAAQKAILAEHPNATDGHWAGHVFVMRDGDTPVGVFVIHGPRSVFSFGRPVTRINVVYAGDDLLSRLD